MPQPPDTLIAGLLARCVFPPGGSQVTCAVSGGPDSLALLVLAIAAGCDVTAVHVDHGLRPGSAGEAEVVRSAAARFGARFVAARVQLEAGPNLEARARTARFGVLPPGVLTGHTADDQAETVLVNLLRGAGSDGLSAMAPERHPLLALRRRDTVALCRHVELAPVTDPSNLNSDHVRNRIRHEVIPLLDDVARREVVPLLTRLAELSRADADLLDALAGSLDPTDARALADAPLALARRAVRRWLTVEGYPPDLASVERVLAVARGDVRGCEVIGGREVRRSHQRLTLR